MDKALFEAVQQKLSEHQSHKTLTRQKSDHLLKDLLFDDAGHRMIATHTTKAGARYRYYVSQPGLHGEARTACLGSVSRVSAPDIEQAIVSALREHFADDQPRGEIDDEQVRFDRTTLATLISRIEVQEKSTRHLRKANERHHRARGPINPLAKASFKASPQNPPAARHTPRQFEARARRTTRSSRQRHRTRTPLAR
jgi:site-specific DNA recombinase